MIKKIIVLICVIWGTSAYSYTRQQTGANPKDSIMITTERFDFEDWKIRLETGTTTYTKEDGTEVDMFAIKEPSIIEILPPPSFLTKQKNYYKKGELGRISYFIGGLPVGLWKYYDEKGNLIKQVDEDAKFGKIKPEDILRFLDKEGYINVKTGEGRFDEDGRETFRLAFVSERESTILDDSKRPATWYVIIEDSSYNNDTKTTFTINGDTGEIIDKKSEKMLNIE